MLQPGRPRQPAPDGQAGPSEGSRAADRRIPVGRRAACGVSTELALAALAERVLPLGCERVVAEGTIDAGSWTSSNPMSSASLCGCQVEGVESFCFVDPPGNATVRTRTDTSSPRFNVDIWLHSNDTGFPGGCDEGRAWPVGGGGRDELHRPARGRPGDGRRDRRRRPDGPARRGRSPCKRRDGTTVGQPAPRQGR